MQLDRHVRRLLIGADSFCTGGRVLSWFRRRGAARLLARICARSGLRTFAVHYSASSFSSFAALCDRYGSDKGTRSGGPHPYGHPPHMYADFYASLFDHCRMSVRKVFECGLGTNNPHIPSNMGITGRPGASLRAWRDYFPNAFVYGADIDREVLFTEDRIATFYVDQTCPTSIAALWNDADLKEFDIIIDDGLHTFEAGVTFFEHSHARLRPGGVYVIEDVTLPTLERFAGYFASRSWEVAFVTFAGHAGDPESCLVVVRIPDSPAGR